MRFFFIPFLQGGRPDMNVRLTKFLKSGRQGQKMNFHSTKTLRAQGKKALRPSAILQMSTVNRLIKEKSTFNRRRLRTHRGDTRSRISRAVESRVRRRRSALLWWKAELLGAKGANRKTGGRDSFHPWPKRRRPPGKMASRCSRK